MNKAYKFRIYPNEVQKEKIEKTFSCVRFIFNKMLTDKIEHYEHTGKKLINTPAQYKKEFPWLKEVDVWHLQTHRCTYRRLTRGFSKIRL